METTKNNDAEYVEEHEEHEDETEKNETEKNENEVEVEIEENDSSQDENQPEVITLEEQMKIFKSEKRILKDENKKLSNELETLKDRLARTLAEYDNYRKRTSKEKEGIYTDACGDILKNMFPILDNLERAAEVDGNFDDIKKGIEITLKVFYEVLAKLQVEEIDASGEFDPNFHNAVMHVEDEKVGQNQVVEVLQKGYKKSEKILRYSMVKVAN